MASCRLSASWRASRIAAVHFGKISIFGVGLLGGSLGKALRERGLAEEVTGWVRRPAAGEEALARGAVDRFTLDPAEAAAQAELLVLCTPVGRMEQIVGQWPKLQAGAVVTDVGSVKAPLVDALEEPVAARGGRFVGSHPMAGSERTGVAHARADLFEGAVCVVTPTGRSENGSVLRVEGLWRAVGGRPLRLDPEQHDAWVSRASHLPHLTAAALVLEVLGAEQPAGLQALCATGFRDTTRVASGSVDVWHDIVLHNGRHLAEALEGLRSQIEALRRVIETGNRDALRDFLTQAKELRDRWEASAGKARPPKDGIE